MIKWKGAAIYFPEERIAILKNRPTWTVSQVARAFKCGCACAAHFIDYAQNLGVIGYGQDQYGRYSVIVEPLVEPHSNLLKLVHFDECDIPY